MINDIELEKLELPYEERWENLTLSNDFLFGKVFQDKELCLELVRIILPGLKIKSISTPVLQKTVKETLETRGVRFDIYLEDDENRVINIEIQTTNRNHLRKRTRTYRSLIDLEVLDRKKIEKYEDMPEVIVIFICDFDLFQKGRHFYEFKNICVQDRDLFLEDGASTIFLSTVGKFFNDVSPELGNFLKFLRGETSSEDPFIRKLERRLKKAKQNASWRRNYMLSRFERRALLDKGFDEGIAIGEKRGISIGEERERKKNLNIVSSLLGNAGINPEIIAQLKNALLSASSQ